MTKRIATLLLTVCLTVGAIGCTITTSGEANWEVYAGVRTKQHGEKPAKVGVESSILDKVVDSLTGGEVTETE